jgi:hypothetical protein
MVDQNTVPQAYASDENEQKNYLTDIFVVIANAKVFSNFLGIDAVLPRKMRKQHRIIIYPIEENK